MPEIPFKTCGDMTMEFIKRGALKRWEMEYHGIIDAKLGLGKSIGPAAWKSKDGSHVLLVFQNEGGLNEYAVVEQDPESTEVVETYMTDYGHGVADLVEATRVNFTMRRIEVQEVANFDVETVARFSNSYLQDGAIDAHFTNSTSLVREANWSSGVDSPTDNAYVSVNFFGAQIYERMCLDGLTPETLLTGSKILAIRPRIRLRSSQPGNGIGVACSFGGSSRMLQYFYPSAVDTWETKTGLWADLGFTAWPAASLSAMVVDFWGELWGNDGVPVDVSEFEIQVVSTD